MSYQTVHGWSVEPAEREWLREHAALIEAEFPQPIMVNIGVLHGATMHCLRAGAPSARLYGVDIDFTSYPVMGGNELEAVFIEGDSGVCHVNFKYKIHLLFIDGDHLYPAVKADIAGWVPKVVMGGVVGFHDYGSLAPHVAGVKQAVNEWFAREQAHWEPLQPANSVMGYRRIS